MAVPPVYRADGRTVNYTATAFKQSCANFRADQRSKELQVYQRGHYGGLNAAQKWNTYLLAFGGLSVALISMTTGGITLYFGGAGKAAAVYLATWFLGMTGVVVNCEKEYP